ncbi:MAG: hypothetical protein DHS20C20_15230 [Ardenticatenaceae bacterium]|nr:MAG: hypothetical protein DHS20C20_15230 [Ardenticatenaceae bacterium]
MRANIPFVPTNPSCGPAAAWCPRHAAYFNLLYLGILAYVGWQTAVPIQLIGADTWEMFVSYMNLKLVKNVAR